MLTIEIIKQQIGGIQAKLDFRTIEPFTRFAERWFTDQVGREMMVYLTGQTTALYPPAPGSDEYEVLDLALACMSWRAYELAFPHLKLRASDLGLQKLNTQNTVAVAKWEYVDSREANLAMLDLALENFWQAVEQIRPAAWTGSAAYRQRQQVFVRSAAEISLHIPTLGRKNRLFEQLLTYVRRAENIYIKPILTESVYRDLKANWSNPDAILTRQESELVAAIQPALAHLALFEAYPYLPLWLDTTGITERRSKDGTMEEVAPDKDSKSTQRRQLYQDGLMYVGDLRNYLKVTATETMFSGFYQAHKPRPNQSTSLNDSDSTLVIL